MSLGPITSKSPIPPWIGVDDDNAFQYDQPLARGMVAKTRLDVAVRNDALQQGCRLMDNEGKIRIEKRKKRLRSKFENGKTQQAESQIKEKQHQSKKWIAKETEKQRGS